jgi:hypothetical protein
MGAAAPAETDVSYHSPQGVAAMSKIEPTVTDDISTSVTVPIVIPCRVCGKRFWRMRFDAVTCSPRCRQRLRRGHAFEYLAALSLRDQRIERELHAALDEVRAAQKEATAAGRRARDARREVRLLPFRRQVRLEMIVENARRMGEADTARHRQKALATVAGTLKFFASQGRDVSAEAMAEFLKMPDVLAPALIAELLDELKASGDYDRIVEDGRAMRPGNPREPELDDRGEGGGVP